MLYTGCGFYLNTDGSTLETGIFKIVKMLKSRVVRDILSHHTTTQRLLDIRGLARVRGT